MENRFDDSTKRARLERRTAPALALSLGLVLFTPVFGQQARQTQTSERTSETTTSPKYDFRFRIELTNFTQSPLLPSLGRGYTVACNFAGAPVGVPPMAEYTY